MRLVCPNCGGAQYEVDDRVIPDTGRDVQCSNCGHGWFQKHPDQDAELAEELGTVPPVAEPDSMTEADTAQEPVPDPPEPTPDPPAPQEASAPPEVDPPEDEDAPPEPDLPPPPPRRRRRWTMGGCAIFCARKPNSRWSSAPMTRSSWKASRTWDWTTRTPPKTHAAARCRNAWPGCAGWTKCPMRRGQRRAARPVAGYRRDQLDPGWRRNRSGQPAPPDATVAPPAKRGGFRRGFLMMLVLAAVIALLYSFAPQLAEAVPALKPYLEAYVALIDKARMALDGLLQSAIGKMQQGGAAEGG